MDSDEQIKRYEAFQKLKLRVGQYVVECDVWDHPEPQETMFGVIRPEVEFSGFPAEIIAIDYPFVATTDGQRVFTSDCRKVKLKRVSMSYARNVLSKAYSKVSSPLTNLAATRGKPIEQEIDEDVCPRCGDKLVERMVQFPSGTKWVRVCRNCDDRRQPNRIVLG